MRILILGGTQEARLLCLDPQLWRHHEVIFSLAGVTQAPLRPHLQTRIGGFGGISGLLTFLQTKNIDAIIDATHPFASQMSRNVVCAAEAGNFPLLRFSRPPWSRRCDDDWIDVTHIDDVPSMLGRDARIVLLTTGRAHLAPFLNLTSHQFYLRSIDAVTEPLPPHITSLRARPPFTVADELALFQHFNIEMIVTKNSGAPAVAAKLEAARLLQKPVVMVARPNLPPAEEVETHDAAMKWIAKIGSGKLALR